MRGKWSILINIMLIITGSAVLIQGADGDVEPNDTPDSPEKLINGYATGSVNISGNTFDIDCYLIIGKGYFDMEIFISNTGDGSDIRVLLYEYNPPDRTYIINETVGPKADHGEYHYGFNDEMTLILEISGNGSYEVRVSIYDNRIVDEPYADDAYMEEETVFSPFLTCGACLTIIFVLIVAAVVIFFIAAIWKLNQD